MNLLRVPVYRNPNLLRLAAKAPKCFCCGRDNDGTVVACHSNEQTMGKGMGIKAADVVAYCCATCHEEIDGRNSLLTPYQRKSQWAMAATRSIRWALENHPEVFR